jgi:hypothetical protein
MRGKIVEENYKREKRYMKNNYIKAKVPQNKIHTRKIEKLA